MSVDLLTHPEHLVGKNNFLKISCEIQLVFYFYH
jgi:hypothetical protein